MKPLLKLVSFSFRLRTLFALLTLLLLLLPLSVSWLTLPNRWLFQAGVELSAKPEPTSSLIAITTSSQELERLVEDVPGALQLGQLLEGATSVYTRGVVVLLDQLPRDKNLLMNVLQNNGSTKNSGDKVELILARQQRFERGIDKGELLLAVAENEKVRKRVSYLRESQRVDWLTEDTDEVTLDTVVQKVLSYDRGAFHQQMLNLASFRFESSYQALPFYQGNSIAYPLLWQVDDAVFPDIVLETFRKSTKSKKVVYRENQLELGNQVLPLSAGAVIYPFYSPAIGKLAPIETVGLSDFLKAKDFQRLYNKTVLVGVEDSDAIQNVGSALHSLDKQVYYTVPSWYLLAEKGGLILLFVYVFYILPFVRMKIALVASAFSAVALIVISLGIQLTEQQWLPMGLLLCYLFTGYAIVLWQQMTSRWFGEWELLVVEKGSLPPVKPGQNALHREPSGVNKKQKGDKSAIFKMLEKTMAITRPGSNLKLGRYEVDEELGRGAMGVVYLGHDPLIDRKVAIKTLNYEQFAPHEIADVKARFFREAKAVGKFNHENIVTIYDTGEESSRAFIAMEFVDGEPLSKHVHKKTLIRNLDVVYWLMESVADALHYAHTKGVIHRDIKPSNILYDEVHGKVKVSDFGIARIVDSSATRTGEIMGSPLYMSPEQVKGETVTGKTDIYSLGVTFYQLLTGELPFTGDTIPAITHQIVQGKYTKVTELNPRLPESANKIITKAMHKDPKRRYADAEAMMADIAKFREKDF